MTGPTRSSPARHQPKRPPNAWILYRKDKGGNLTPPPDGRRRPQAEVSKIIGAMWASESEETRHEYERRADVAKAEHHMMYPDYRFKPMKREEKERLREEARQEKERGRAESRRARVRPAPYAASFAGPSTLYPTQFYHQQEAIYGNAGPSPPLSAASSPYDSPCSGSQQGSDDHSNPPSNHASPSPYSASNNATPSSGDPAELSYSQFVPPVALQSTTSPQLSLPGPCQWQQQPATGNGPPAALAPIWQGYQPNPPRSTLESSISQDFLNFNLPAPPDPGWGQGESNSQLLNDSMRAMLSATRNPSIFQLSDLTAEDLISNPQGEIEVSMGQVPLPFDQHFLHPPEFFSGFDFGTTATDSNNIDLSQTLAPNEAATDFSMFLDPTLSSSNQQRDVNSYGMLDYLNLEATASDVHPAPTTFSQLRTNVEETNVEETEANVEPTSAVPSTPYVPPSGAAHSSTRRVGASWKPPFDSIEQSSPRRVSAG